MKILSIAAMVSMTLSANAAGVEYTTKPAPEYPFQILAQKRIEARASWSRVRPEIKECIDDKLEIDGLSIAELMGLGVLPSDNFLKNYREQCFASVLGKTK